MKVMKKLLKSPLTQLPKWLKIVVVARSHWPSGVMARPFGFPPPKPQRCVKRQFPTRARKCAEDSRCFADGVAGEQSNAEAEDVDTIHRMDTRRF